MPLNTALIVAHPGHELRLHGWLEMNHPEVFVLTDGSGHTTVSRLSSTERVLDATGCRPAPVFGRMTDREVYRAILSGDVDPFVQIVKEISEELVRQQVSEVVGDAAEFYNPVHDLCRVMINLAVERCEPQRGRGLRNFEVSLLAARDHCLPSDRHCAVHIRLDDQALDRKLASALEYQELNAEVSDRLDTYGREVYRTECIKPLDGSVVVPRPAAKPFYEDYGEQRVKAGYYQQVLRYREHFLPFATELVRRVRAQ